MAEEDDNLYQLDDYAWHRRLVQLRRASRRTRAPAQIAWLNFGSSPISGLWPNAAPLNLPASSLLPPSVLRRAEREQRFWLNSTSLVTPPLAAPTGHFMAIADGLWPNWTASLNLNQSPHPTHGPLLLAPPQPKVRPALSIMVLDRNRPRTPPTAHLTEARPV